MSKVVNYNKISKYDVLLSLLKESLHSMENDSFNNGFSAIWETIGIERDDFYRTDEKVKIIVDGKEKELFWYDLDDMLLDIIIDVIESIERANRNETGSLILITEDLDD
jgi:hypothetical protein